MTGEGTIPTEIAGAAYRPLDAQTLEFGVAEAVEMSLDELHVAIRNVLGLRGSFTMYLGLRGKGASHASAHSIFRGTPSVGFYNKYSGFGPPPPECIAVQTNPFLTFLSPRNDFEVGG